MATNDRHMPSELNRIAESIKDYPTIVEIDEMLAVLSGFPDSAGDTEISDGLLEMRTLLTAAERAPACPDAPSADAA